eukprot:UN31847
MAESDQSMDEDEEQQIQYCDNPTVFNKYADAGRIAQKVLMEIVQAIQKGETNVHKLCKFGDDRIKEETNKTDKKLLKSDKGVAFPTSISKNELAGHCSPVEDVKSTNLTKGDVVKIDLGVHLDGYASLAATTTVVGNEKISGPKANVIAATWTAAQCALAMMKPGVGNEEITEMFEKIGKEFGCTCLEGVLSHELKQYLIDGEKSILGKTSVEQQVEKFELEPYHTYAIDVVFSTGTGKAIQKGIHKTTVFKRVIDQSYQLKGRAARGVLKKLIPIFQLTHFHFVNLTQKH